MGVVINHAISFLTSPLSVAFAALIAGVVLACRWRRLGVTVVGLAIVWLYCLSSGWMYLMLGLGLERQFPPARVETLPQSDAIVVLGGGVGGNTNVLHYTELFSGADRVAHAARLWKAGKAPVVIPSGANEWQTARPLLMEFGVPESAILVENKSRNTEENVKFIVRMFECSNVRMSDGSECSIAQGPKKEGRKPRVLLVTSAFHMRRAKLMFERYAPALEVIPAACDYETTLFREWAKWFDYLLPSAGSLGWTSVMLKEYIGYWGYRLLR